MHLLHTMTSIQLHSPSQINQPVVTNAFEADKWNRFVLSIDLSFIAVHITSPLCVYSATPLHPKQDRLMQMLVGEKDPTEMRALARQLVHRDLGLPDALFCDFQNMLLAIIKSEAGPQDAMDAITGMTPALAKYLLDDAPIIKENGSDAVGCVSGIDQMDETD